jgi:hypothetical protein
MRTMCQTCNDTGVVRQSKGTGMYYIGPCNNCDKHLENELRAIQEMQEMLDQLSRSRKAVVNE